MATQRRITPATADDLEKITQEKMHPSCLANGHNYQPMSDADTRTSLPDGSTEIHRPLWCTKCGELISHHVSTWQPRKTDNSSSGQDSDNF